MTQQEFTAALAENRTRAEEIAAALPGASDEETEALVREFISCKYFLTAEEMVTDDLIRLGDRSTEKLADLQKGGLRYADKNAGCTTAGSSTIKKVLLAMALGKAIGTKLDADDVAYAETIPQLARLVIRVRADSRSDTESGN